MNIMQLSQVLTALASGALIGGILAFLLEKLNAFQNLPAQVKNWLVFLLCMVLPLVGWLGLHAFGYNPWPVGSTAWAEGIFYELEIGFASWVASQGWHLAEKAARK